MSFAYAKSDQIDCTNINLTTVNGAAYPPEGGISKSQAKKVDPSPELKQVIFDNKMMKSTIVSLEKRLAELERSFNEYKKIPQSTSSSLSPFSAASSSVSATLPESVTYTNSTIAVIPTIANTLPKKSPSAKQTKTARSSPDDFEIIPNYKNDKL